MEAQDEQVPDPTEDQAPLTQMSMKEIQDIHTALAKTSVEGIREMKDLLYSLDEAERNEPLGVALQLHIMRLEDDQRRNQREMVGFTLAIDLEAQTTDTELVEVDNNPETNFLI